MALCSECKGTKEIIISEPHTNLVDHIDAYGQKSQYEVTGRHEVKMSCPSCVKPYCNECGGSGTLPVPEYKGITEELCPSCTVH